MSPQDLTEYLKQFHTEIEEAEPLDLRLIPDELPNVAIRIKTRHFGEHIFESNGNITHLGEDEAFYSYNDFDDFTKIMNEIDGYFKLEHMS